MLILIIAPLITGGVTSYWANKRGRDPFFWFFIGSLFGLFGTATLFLLPAIKKKNEPAEKPKAPFVYAAQEWFYLGDEEEQVGPIPFYKLRNVWKEGKIKQENYVWCEVMEEWKKVKELVGFEGELS